MSDGGRDGGDRTSPLSKVQRTLAGAWTRLGSVHLRTAVVLVALGALVAGFGGGFIFAQVGGSGSVSGNTGVAEGVAPRGVDWPLFGKPRAKGAARPERTKPAGFAVWRHRVDTSGAEPRACIEMSRPLDPRAAYADYVLLSPDPGGTPAVTAAGSELCIGGLGFADRRVTLLKGLPGRGEDKLAANADIDFVFGEIPPFVGFVGEGVILPREDADGVAIETVNVERLDVEVWRVPDHNLVRASIVASEPVAEGDYMGSWGEDYPNDQGRKVWAGTVPVTGPAGERATTVFPLGAVLREMKPGGYILVARDASGARRENADQDGDEDDYGPVEGATARRWVIFTDMALTSYSGSDGLDAVVRSLATARTLAGTRVALVAANGETLAEGSTNTEGRIRFARSLLEGRQGLSPRMLLAYGQEGDLAILDLTRAPVDLSRQGVGGRPGEDLTGGRDADTAVDAYAYADRGIYRPGETAHLVALVRDRSAQAVNNRRGALVVYRPSGVVFGRYAFDNARGGYISKDVAIPRTAPRGRWRAEVELEGIDRPVGGLSFQVEDFAPQRLAVDAEAGADTPVKAGETRAINFTARFLYGAPGAGLQTQGEARLSEDVNPFPAFEGYRFGDDQEPFRQQALTIPSTVTDGAGRAVFSLPASEAGDTATPLRAVVTASVFEPGGRPVRESVFLKVRPKPLYLGVKVQEQDARGRDRPVDFDIVALDPEGRRIAASGVQWTLITENWDYNWYQQNGRWQWRRTSRDVIAARGTGEIGAERSLAFRRNLNWGDYRLEVTGPDGARTVVKFAAGWGAPAREGDAPDLVRVTAGERDYAQGDTVDVTIKAPYAGQAQIAVATDRVIELRTVAIGEDGAVVRLKSTPEWGGGAYVLVSVIQPRDPARTPTPRRAMGVAYVPLDPADRKLAVAIGAPEKIHSRDEIEVPVRVTGSGALGRARVTVAAVDEGILRLTGFRTPDPVAWYFGKRALGVDYRDDYARLLDPNLGAPANVNFGGDEIGGEGLTVTPIKTVALWSGVVETGLDGRATVRLPAAEFNGELRLMAVAWTDSAVGSAAKAMTVREPVVADLSLPRFLSPGDRATATLELHNLEGAPGQYEARVTARGGLAVQLRRLVSLALGQRTAERIELAAPPEAGIGEVEMTVSGPGEFSTSKTYPLQTRLGWGAEMRTFVAQQGAGEAFTPPASMIAGLLPGTVTMHVSYSPFRGFDPAAVALALHGYRYGCTEQIVSTAYPLLYADRIEPGQEPASRRGLDNAAQQLLGRQSLDGAFGLWRVGDGEADPWLGAYVTDFLLEAQQRGAAVPQEAVDRALSAMRQVAQPEGYSSVAYRLSYPVYWQQDARIRQEMTRRMRSRASAYALYVMAKGGKGDLARLRWWHDVQMKNDPSPVARAQIGAGLGRMGDKARARSALRAAISALGYRDENDWYQSPLRDLAAVIVYAFEAGETDLARSLQARLEDSVKDPDRLNTQEQARLLQAAHAMLQANGPASITETGAIDLPPVAGQPRWAVGLVTDARFVNSSRNPIWRTVTVRGTPVRSPPPAANGASVTKTLHGFSGGALSPGGIVQGDRIIVRISGANRQGRTALMVVDDPLPAGWEIETLLGPEDAQNGPFRFLGVLSGVNVQEKRDDRYVAAVEVPGNQSFSVAYIARAVTPGTYYLPGAAVSDMYRPQVNARSAGSRATIAPRP